MIKPRLSRWGIIIKGLGLLFLLSACSGPQALSNQPISDLSYPDTLGVFTNASEGYFWPGYALWNQLYFNNESDTSNWRLKEVRLILLSESLLQAQLLAEDSVQDCVILSGKLKSTDFNLNRQHHYDPLFYVVSVYGFNDSRIALDPNRNLICKNSSGALLLGGFVFPFFGANPPPTIMTFLRVP